MHKGCLVKSKFISVDPYLVTAFYHTKVGSPMTSGLVGIAEPGLGSDEGCPIGRHVRSYGAWAEEQYLPPGALELLPDAMLKLECEAYVGEALDLEATFRERLIALPPEDFESLLHSVFKADEWKLVALGGVLGVLIGVAQAYLLDDAWAL